MEFGHAFANVFRTILSTFALASITILAVILYGFYYPAPYAHQSARQLPVVVVDEERSALTRKLIRNLGAAREVRIVAEAQSVHEAQAMVLGRQADGILLLSHGLDRSLRTGAPGTGIGIWVNGTYLIRARDIGDAIQAAALGVAVQQLQPFGEGLHLVRPIEVVERPLFNTRAGYADYVFPAVAAIILQQTLLFGAAMLVAGRSERGAARMGHGEFLGAWCALSLIGIFGAFLYFGWIFWYQDVPRGHNIAGLFVAVPLFAAAVSALGMLIGSCLDRADRALHVLIPTSVVLFFLGGAAWPLSSMPAWLAAVAHLSPATLGMQTFVRLNEMGARLTDVAASLLGLLALALTYAALAFYRVSPPKRQRPSPSQGADGQT